MFKRRPFTAYILYHSARQLCRSKFESLLLWLLGTSLATSRPDFIPLPYQFLTPLASLVSIDIDCRLVCSQSTILYSERGSVLWLIYWENTRQFYPIVQTFKGWLSKFFLKESNKAAIFNFIKLTPCKILLKLIQRINFNILLAFIILVWMPNSWSISPDFCKLTIFLLFFLSFIYFSTGSKQL